MNTAFRTRIFGVCVILLHALVGCSNGRSSVEDPAEGGEAPPPGGGSGVSYGVGGTVSGLMGAGLTLQNNQGDNLAIATDGEFEFATPVRSGAAYNVTISTQPANQVCTVERGTGTVGEADVANILVTCATNAYRVGGSVSGLAAGASVALINNGERLEVGQNGPYAFVNPVATNAGYNVAVDRHPESADQTCVVANPNGTMGTADVSNVNVTCATSAYVVEAAVTGLQGSGLVLRLNGSMDRAVSADSVVQFPSTLMNGAPYEVKVATEPSNPSQTCTVANGAGTIARANVRVAVTCVTNAFRIGGTVTGMQGGGLMLANGADQITINANGEFFFPQPVLSRQRYEVTVLTNPATPPQVCSVEKASGRVGSGDVRDIVVTCALQRFTLAGTVSGLQGRGLVLQVSGNNAAEVQSDGAFTFPQPLATGTAYTVTVRTPPSEPTQACSIDNANGTITNQPVNNIAVKCTTSAFTIGGTVSGLQGTGLRLTNNGGDEIPIGTDGPFNFPTPINSNSTYTVAVSAQPTSPAQVCTVTNERGRVADRNVTTVAVNCERTEFTVGGTVTGLLGSNLQLQLNGGAPITIAPIQGQPATFTFPGSLTTNTAYSVAVASQPQNPWQTCTVGAAGTGTIGRQDVTNVQISCETLSFPVGGTISNAGLGLQLQLNGGEVLNLYGTGNFQFAPLPSGTPYEVLVVRQPFLPQQTCTVTNGSGTVGGEPVSSVAVTCQ